MDMFNYLIAEKENNYIDDIYTKFPSGMRVIIIGTNLKIFRKQSFAKIPQSAFSSILQKARMLDVIIDEKSHIYNGKKCIDYIYLHGTKENIKLLQEFIKSIEIKC